MPVCTNRTKASTSLLRAMGWRREISARAGEENSHLIQCKPFQHGGRSKGFAVPVPPIKRVNGLFAKKETHVEKGALKMEHTREILLGALLLGALCSDQVSLLSSTCEGVGTHTAQQQQRSLECMGVRHTLRGQTASESFHSL